MQHKIVSQSEWLNARKALLAKEKEFSKARDALSAARRDLPWTPVEKNYVFDGPNGARFGLGIHSHGPELIDCKWLAV